MCLHCASIRPVWTIPPEAHARAPDIRVDGVGDRDVRVKAAGITPAASQIISEVFLPAAAVASPSGFTMAGRERRAMAATRSKRE